MGEYKDSTRKGVVAERLFTGIGPPCAAVYRGTAVGVVVDVDGRTRVDATAKQASVRTPFPEVDTVHVIPSEEYASVFVPKPPATHRVPFHATALQVFVNSAVPEAEAVHVIPSEEYARRFVPSPPATHCVPFHATALQ